ncbi:MAG: RagB/SusD family nutrient uptake outer membrane protein [Bacteroidales bacterium]|nr:RagB/SusD family nutrient uptake outer membrane protein [Bacteroidales bacterium]
MEKKYLLIIASLVVITSCSEDFLNKEPLVDTVIENFYKTGNDAVLAVNAAYVPLEWEFNHTYFNEWMLGDVVSDDALKGGNNINDMNDLFLLENFTATPSNEVLLEFYRAQYQGIYRCNLAINKIPEIQPDETMDISLKNRLVAEAKFLRAYYYFRLVRVFGGIPKITLTLDPSEYKQPRALRDTIYSLIYNDLESAIPGLWLKSLYADEDLGRATKGAAQALLMKAYLYNQEWTKAKAWGDSVILSGEYDLEPGFSSNFSLAGENGTESVFEVQYMEEPTSDYGDGNGYTRGTFIIIMQRTRVGSLGWGFNRPTVDLLNEFESGDPRRNATITGPDGDLYLGNGYHSRKYALEGYTLAHPTRGPLNQKVIRFSDVLLMYAEAACEINDLPAAKAALERVRLRARNNNPSVLPAFPYGSYTDNQEDLRDAIRHERRVELAMEGHRFFDLVRWGIAEQVMNAYRENESVAITDYMMPFETGKHDLFPIPETEINLNNLLLQNPNY